MSNTVPLRVARTSLHQQVAERIRTMILNHQLLPGDKIDESALCQQFDVSRTPLREALKVLSNEGLIELLNHRGARVAVTRPHEVRQLFPIIGALEALAGELACAHVTAGDISYLQSLHDDMLRCYRQQDDAGYARLNREIHLGFFQLADNPALMALYQQLTARTHAVRHVARKSQAEWLAAIDDHEKMLIALRHRDGALMADILRRHLQHKAEMVLAFLAAAEA
ncbi:GntR family transcriptional regulator [Biostraticola tofi]|uniref:DNA-binding GntR family transcriptional regulator n=1 Tax=Biostraticola tofi TaxID=466109 RepID=A0A4R3Z1R1_9GAMM|nr:GntR family transcriptional regulator [Biostraticola tofi]TCV98935.1 DNA-binding GntR family transcriptional regulator [Biostraticola tofi]